MGFALVCVRSSLNLFAPFRYSFSPAFSYANRIIKTHTHIHSGARGFHIRHDYVAHTCVDLLRAAGLSVQSNFHPSGSRVSPDVQILNFPIAGQNSYVEVAVTSDCLSSRLCSQGFSSALVCCLPRGARKDSKVQRHLCSKRLDALPSSSGAVRCIWARAEARAGSGLWSRDQGLYGPLCTSPHVVIPHFPPLLGPASGCRSMERVFPHARRQCPVARGHPPPCPSGGR